MSITPYPAVALIFDRMSPAYSFTRTLSTSRRRLTFKQESGSERRSGTKQINCIFAWNYCCQKDEYRVWQWFGAFFIETQYCPIWNASLGICRGLQNVARGRRPRAAAAGNIFNSEVTVFNCMYGPHSRQITSLFFPAVNWLTSGFVSFFQLFHWIDSRPVYKPFVKYSS